MKEINLGQLVSLIHCKKCDMPIDITISQESIRCPNCNKIINLKYNFGIDLAKDKKTHFK